MNLPPVVTRDEWLAARKDLLAKEKELTRRIDAINADRRRLPMVLVDKPYRFGGPDGPVGLRDLFGDSRQLIVQHVMFDPSWADACPACTASIDEMSDGLIAHLRARETAFALVSRAPIEKIEAYQLRRGWTIPWYSSYDSDFNYDFHVTLDESVAPVLSNYRTNEECRQAGLPALGEGGQSNEYPGLSCFLRDGENVYHTYSTYARGTDHLGGAYGFLDLTALGRQEEWEEPKGRAGKAWAAVPDFAR